MTKSAELAMPVFFTIVSRNYLAYALTLLGSIAEQYPSAKRYLCLADSTANDPTFKTDLFETISIDELGLPNFEAFTFRYEIMELNTAVKPYMFNWLQQRHPNSGLIYIDPDILVLKPLSHVENELAAGASMVLTPHLNAPISDDKHPDELAIMRSGVYNCGFVAINAAHPSAQQIIVWWCKKLEFGCYVDLAAGLFTDQKWMDLAPSMFPDVSILRHDGYNLAYWNLAQRPVEFSPDQGYMAAGVPLIFVHFSGVALSNPNAFSKHQNRFTYADIGGLQPLYDKYLSLLQKNSHNHHAKKPYAYSYFKSGVKICAPMRRVYRQFFDIGKPFEIRNPLSIDPTVFNQLSDDVPNDENAPISRLMFEIWRSRDDLRAVFDLSSHDGREGFIRWYISTANHEVNVDPVFIEPIRNRFCKPSSGNAKFNFSDAPVLNDPTTTLSTRPYLAKYIVAAIDWGRRQRSFAHAYAKLPADLRKFVSQKIRKIEKNVEPSWHYAAPHTLQKAIGERGVNLIGYARGEFGVAENIRSYARALERADYPFVIRNFEVGVQSRLNDRSMDHRISEYLRYSANLFFVNADQMELVREGLGAKSFSGRYNIGYWLWELEQFPAAWDHAFDLVDEVWTPTKFVCDAISARGKKSVCVIPKAIEFDMPSNIGRANFGLNEGEFVFLYSYDFNSFASRKNPEAAIKAFREAFANTNYRTRLLIKSINGHRFPDRLKKLEDSISADKNIEIRDGFLSRPEMFALQNSVDCYVSLHRAEGFGLGMAESMYLGKPVIATAYSGNMEFMSPTNSCLVDYKLVPLMDGDYPFWVGQHWAEADVSAAARYMRLMLEEPGYAVAVGAAGADSIRRTNSKRICSDAVTKRLEEVFQRRGLP